MYFLSDSFRRRRAKYAGMLSYQYWICGLKSKMGVNIFLHLFSVWIRIPFMCSYSLMIIDASHFGPGRHQILVRLSRVSKRSVMLWISNCSFTMLLYLYLLPYGRSIFFSHHGPLGRLCDPSSVLVRDVDKWQHVDMCHFYVWRSVSSICGDCCVGVCVGETTPFTLVREFYEPNSFGL